MPQRAIGVDETTTFRNEIHENIAVVVGVGVEFVVVVVEGRDKIVGWVVGDGKEESAAAQGALLANLATHHFPRRINASTAFC